MAKQPSFLNSVKWAYTGNWGEKIFSGLFSIIVAGILGPRDFGVAAIALVYIGFLQLFLDQGLAAALIQRKHLEQEHADAVFWMDLALSVFLVAVSILFSRSWAAINHAPQVAVIIPVYSLCIVIEALSIVQTALLRRDMDFKSLSIRTNVSVLLSGIFGIVLAFKGFGVWALVAQQLAKDVIALTLLWKLSRWHPRFEFSWKHLKDLLSFSIPNFGAQLGVFADGQAGSIVLGLFFGPVAVGLYRIAERVTNSIVTMAMASIQSVALPQFSRLQDQPEELAKSVLTCIRLSAAVTLPSLAGLAAVSYPLMATVGVQWIPAVPALKVLSALGMISIFGFFTGPLMQALGKTRQIALLEWARAIVNVAILACAGLLAHSAAVNWQVMAISMGRFAASFFLVVPVFVYILLSLCRISLRDFFFAVVPSICAAISTAGTVMLFHLLVGAHWLNSAKPAVVLGVEVGLGGIVGLAVLLRLESQLYRSVVGMIKGSARSADRDEELSEAERETVLQGVAADESISRHSNL
jgi:O-antigen/teichoic acid export membrane protein